MTYPIRMEMTGVPTAASPAAGTSVAPGSIAVTPNTMVVMVIGGLGTLCTGVSNTGAVGGTWTLAASVLGTGVSTEIWIGYNFTGSATVAQTVTWAGSTKAAYTFVLLSTSSPVASITAGTPATATGSSVTPDPGTVTPAVDDFVVDAACWANVTASSARTDTPGGAEQFQTITSSAATATRVESSMRGPVKTTTATKRTFTITSGQWSAANVAITLPNATEAASHLYRGQETKALDDAGSY